MNYSELTSLLQDYLQTTETAFVNDIPTFVRQAEERINRAVIIPDLRKTDTLTMSTGTETVSKPSDYLTTFSLQITTSGSERFLLLKDENFLREAHPDTTDTGTPKYYAHRDDSSWSFAPVPDANYDLTVTYYYDPESIVTASTSWLGDNAETVLLYGCLVEGYTYLKGEPDLIQLYEQRYQSALQDLIKLGLVRSKRDDYREGEIRAVM